MSKRGEWTPDLVQSLANMACISRPHGAKTWDPPGVVAGIRRLIERGFGMQEVIDRVFAHAWDASADTPGTLLTPKPRRPETSNPVPYPVTRNEECRLHPGQHPVTCISCAADRIAPEDDEPLPARQEEPPPIDPETGEQLKHRPLRELVDEFTQERKATA